MVWLFMRYSCCADHAIEHVLLRLWVLGDELIRPFSRGANIRHYPTRLARTTHNRYGTLTEILGYVKANQLLYCLSGDAALIDPDAPGRYTM